MSDATNGEGNGAPAKSQRDHLFKPGNPWRWAKGTSGNPGGKLRFERMLEDELLRYYRSNPHRLRELVLQLHGGAIGVKRITQAQIAAIREIARKVDLERLNDDGSAAGNTIVAEGIVLDIRPGQGPERADIQLDADIASGEITFDDKPLLPPNGNGAGNHNNGGS